MAKRNLFNELEQGINEIEQHTAKKITLRTHAYSKKPLSKIDAQTIREIRTQLHLSRPVFALRMGVKLRTLEKWEQGITVPNDQATALILMARKYPDTFNRLAEI